MVATFVVPLDGSATAEAAVVPAHDLARALGASLVLFQATWTDAEGAQRYLAALADQITDVPVTVEVGHGFASTALAELVAARPGSLVCMTSRGHAGVTGIFLGSVAEEVLRAVSEATVVVGPECEIGTPVAGGERRLLACIDSETAAAALEPVARRWAADLELGVDLVVVTHRRGAKVGRLSADEVRPLLDGVAGRLTAAGIDAQVTELDGADPAHAITSHARDRAALVATCARGQRRILGGVLGGTASRVVRHATVPVIVVPPLETS